MQRLARKSAFSIKASEGSIKVIEDFTFEEPKTRKIVDILTFLDIADCKVLLLTAETDRIVYKSARNIPKVQVLEASKSNSYQILDASVLLIQQSALDVIQNTIEPPIEEMTV